MIIRQTAYPRAGLIGNPSDGYFGRTIALAFTNFRAEVTLYESPELEILPNSRDQSTFSSIKGLADDVKLYGYYGGIRLLKATIRKFFDYCTDNGIELHRNNFTIRYDSNIPHMVGLAGSSAIITACMRSLMAFYAVTIPRHELATIVWEVETRELKLSAGLQDRVAQAYQGLVFMDFNKELMLKQHHGKYEPIDPALLPNLYIAFRRTLSEGSEIVHNDLATRFKRGDQAMFDAVTKWCALTEKVKETLLAGKGSEIGPYLDENFDIRAGLYTISDGNMRMIEAARSTGASAKFTGSGGAIIGTYTDEKMFNSLVHKLTAMDIEVFKPVIAPPV